LHLSASINVADFFWGGGGVTAPIGPWGPISRGF